MKTSQTRTLETPHVNDETGWRKTDTVWMLGLYGTAIGAGVLFLLRSMRAWGDCYP